MESLITINYLRDSQEAIFEKFPKLPTNCIIIGLPCGGQLCIDKNTPLSKILLPYVISCRSNFHHSINYSGDYEAIEDVNDIHLRILNRQNDLYGKNKIIKYPDNILDDEKILIVLSAFIQHKSTTENIFIDLDKNAIATSDGEMFSYNDCFVLIAKYEISSLVYDVKLVPLSTHDNLAMADKPIGYDAIHKIYLKALIPA